LAADRDLDHLGSHALVAVRAALRLVIRVGAVSAGKRPLIPSHWRREAVNPDAILDRAIQIRCSVRNTRCIKSDYHPRRIGREAWFESFSTGLFVTVRYSSMAPVVRIGHEAARALDR
jgi:hypothetical protein